MTYYRYELQEELEIRKIITFFYRELPSHFRSNVERHDFWELVYVDKGQIEIVTDSNTLQLSQGDIVFYKPNEYHSGKALHNTAPNLFIITFECSAACMDFFAEQSFPLRDEEVALLSKLMHEGRHAFEPPADSPAALFPQRNLTAPFGSEQLIRNYLEILLIELIRRQASPNQKVTLTTTVSELREQEITDEIISYLEDHVAESLSIEQICQHFAISRTHLKMLIKTRTNKGIIEYHAELKIQRAKVLIREHSGSFTNIADQLGYRSLHYFSRSFKRITGMTPTEYARSVKARYKS